MLFYICNIFFTQTPKFLSQTLKQLNTWENLAALIVARVTKRDNIIDKKDM